MTVIEFDAARRRLLRRRAAGETPMPDTNAIEVSAREIAAPITTTSLLVDVRRLVTGALFTAALAAAGTVLFTLALVVAVVGSPLIAAAIAYVVVRRPRAHAAPTALSPAI
jgi:hypothetical protein